jgi:hypothetical protein
MTEAVRSELAGRRPNRHHFVNLVGIYAVFFGFAEIFAAFDLRRLGHNPDQSTGRPAA